MCRRSGALWDEADVVVAVGSDLDGMMTQGWKMPQPPHLVALNVDPTDASKNYRPDVVIEADAARTARARGPAGRARRARRARARLKELGRTVRARITDEEPEASAFLDAIELALPDDAIVVCDMCIPGYWLGGFHRTPAPRKLSYPLGWARSGARSPRDSAPRWRAPAPP